MAVKSKHGETVRTYDTGRVLFSLMSDGIILRQLRIDGRLEGATIHSRKFRGQAAQVADKLVLVGDILMKRAEKRAVPPSFDHDAPIGVCPCGRLLNTLNEQISARCDVDAELAAEVWGN